MSISVKVFASALTFCGVWGLLESTFPEFNEGLLKGDQVQAQTVPSNNPLPPPPPVPSNSPNPPSGSGNASTNRISVPTIPRTGSSDQNRSAPLREYEFKAGSTSSPSTPGPASTPGRPSSTTPTAARITQTLYRVEVQGSSSWLLSQVKRIESQAYVSSRDGLIQVGVFQQREHAEELVQELAIEGLWARIVTLQGSAAPQPSVVPASPPSRQPSNQPNRQRSPRGRSIFAGSGRFNR